MSETIKIYDDKTQLKYCLQMNCLGCKFNTGSYRQCPHFEAKKKAVDEEK